MRPRFIAVCMLAGVANCGCMWPGIVSAQGDAKVRIADFDNGEVHTRPAGGARVIVIEYWQNPQVNDNPPSFDIVKAYVASDADFAVKLPPRLYTVVFTPALGIQHIVPKAGVVVFAEGFWTAWSIPHDNRRFCCDAPRGTRLSFEPVLRPIKSLQSGTVPDGKQSEEELFLLINRMCALDRVLAAGQGVTESDRLVVYRQLEREADEQLVSAANESGRIDAKRLKKSLTDVRGRIAVLQRKMNKR